MADTMCGLTQSDGRKEEIHFVTFWVEKQQEAQLPQRECASNIALLYSAKGISICLTV